VAERLILVVDDEEKQRRVLAGFLRKAGYEVEAVGSADEALAVVSARTVDVVLTDLRMPGKTGVELLDAVRGLNPEIPVVVMTAYGTVASAVDAMKRGAADYLGKPVDLDELEVLVTRSLERRALVSENRALREQVESRYRLADFETSNADAGSDQHGRPCGGSRTILIHGEAARARALARAIHYASPRRPRGGERRRAAGDAPGSELFGHGGVLSPGPTTRAPGPLRLAASGPPPRDRRPAARHPVKLLRVLQEQASSASAARSRSGGRTSSPLPTRSRGHGPRREFREDLFFRLNVVAITLPPLRDRREHPLLVDHCGASPTGRAGVSRRRWISLVRLPGQRARETENLVHRAVVLARRRDHHRGPAAAPPRRPETGGEG
jgi:DNA-binding NtrC family response regulator